MTQLETPLIIQYEGTTPIWLPDKMFYVLAGNGYYKCRNHQFFESAVRISSEGHPELADFEEKLICKYPKIPKSMLEDIVGFFHKVDKKHSAEAYACIFWDLHDEEVKMLVPEQEVSMCAAEYKLPNYPDHWILLGDVHSHHTMPAYASSIDKDDEVDKPTGLHIVVGHIDKEPPQFHIEIVADGRRFPFKEHELIFEGYLKRTKHTPDEWMEKVTRKYPVWKGGGDGEYSSGCYGSWDGQLGRGDNTPYPMSKMSKQEKKEYKRWWQRGWKS